MAPWRSADQAAGDTIEPPHAWVKAERVHMWGFERVCPLQGSLLYPLCMARLRIWTLPVDRPLRCSVYALLRAALLRQQWEYWV